MYYPKADHIILAQVNEYEVVGTKTADMLLIRDSAYWFSYDEDYHNDLAGACLKFLFTVEGIRKGATDESVCDITSEQAEDIVSTYQSLGTFMQTTYIDCTYVNTWADETRTSKAYVSYRAVIERLAKIANINLTPSRDVDSKSYVNNSSLVVTIIAIATISAAGAAALILIRRRKHQ